MARRQPVSLERATSLYGRSHEGDTTPAASAALWQRLLWSAASGTNQAPTPLTAAALLFSATMAPRQPVRPRQPVSLERATSLYGRASGCHNE